MNIKHTLIAIAFAAVGLTAAAQEVSVNITPGTLSGRSVSPETKSLKITGIMNAADFNYINNTLTELESLDLSEVRIAAYSGNPVLLNRTTFPASYIPDFALAGTKLTTIRLPQNLVEIGEGALSSSAITAIEFPPSLQTIGQGAFSNCNSLTELNIPASVTTIGTNAFSRCDNLADVTWASVSIPADAFSNCVSLSNVTISGAGVTTIGDKAFYGCSSLATINFPASLTTIGTSAFEATGITTLDMTSATALRTLGPWAFSRCPRLTSVRFSDATRSLGEGLFSGDRSLVTISIPESIKELPDYIFKDDNSIDTTAFFHAGITSLGNYSLMGMNHVDSINLPRDLAYIGDQGMAGWSSLNHINATALHTVPDLGDDVWEGIDKSTVGLKVKADKQTDFRNAEQWGEFKIDVESGIDGVTGDPQPSTRVKAWFEGSDLHILADSPITDAAMHDLNGRNYFTSQPRATELVIPTADFSERLYLIRLVLDDNTPVTVKIAR